MTEIPDGVALALSRVRTLAGEASWALRGGWPREYEQALRDAACVSHIVATDPVAMVEATDALFNAAPEEWQFAYWRTVLCPTTARRYAWETWPDSFETIGSHEVEVHDGKPAIHLDCWWQGMVCVATIWLERGALYGEL